MTLFEITLVVTIMVIIGALASPLLFNALYSDTRVSAAADAVRACWADCRAQALEEGRPYRFAVVPNSRKFKIEPYQGTLENADSAFLNDLSGSTVKGLSIEDTLPEGVRFGTKDVPVSTDGTESGGDYVTIAVFLPDGSAQDDVEITFGAKGSAHVTLKLRAYTGSVTTIRGKEQDK
jgi:type II secretory pathway pseudopilin PulG